MVLHSFNLLSFLERFDRNDRCNKSLGCNFYKIESVRFPSGSEFSLIFECSFLLCKNKGCFLWAQFLVGLQFRPVCNTYRSCYGVGRDWGFAVMLNILRGYVDQKVWETLFYDKLNPYFSLKWPNKLKRTRRLKNKTISVKKHVKIGVLSEIQMKT